MRNRVGNGGQNGARNTTKSLKNDTRNHPEGRSKTGLEKTTTKTKTDAFRGAKNLRKYSKVIQNHGFRRGQKNMTYGSEIEPTSTPETSQERPGATQRRHKNDLEIGPKKSIRKYAKMKQTGCQNGSQKGDKSHSKLVPDIDRKTSKKITPAAEAK